jgi:hypothetical protein
METLVISVVAKKNIDLVLNKTLKHINMGKHSWYRQMETLGICKYGFEVGSTHTTQYKC